MTAASNVTAEVDRDSVVWMASALTTYAALVGPTLPIVRLVCVNYGLV